MCRKGGFITNKTTFWLSGAIIIWIALIVGGFYFLHSYNARPGEAATAPAVWPQNEVIARAEGEQTLLIFLHPMCPCSRATIAELEDILAAHGKNMHPIFVMMTSDKEDKEWRHSSLTRSAEAIPGGSVIQSKSEYLEKLFSVYTSGQILLYDAAGKLVFSGGITTSRGEQGENPGSVQLVKILSHLPAQSFVQSPVYGCPLSEAVTTKDKP